MLPAHLKERAEEAARLDVAEEFADADPDTDFDFVYLANHLELDEYGGPHGVALHQELAGTEDADMVTAVGAAYLRALERALRSGEGLEGCADCEREDSEPWPHATSSPRSSSGSGSSSSGSSGGLGETLDDAGIQLQGLGALGGPAWVDRVLTKHWDAIVAATPDGAVPVLEHVGKTKLAGRALGCGHYGCVLPTADDNIVCKVTSDATEAAFVAGALDLGDIPEGMVQYVKIVAVPSDSHRGRPVFVLWREAARDVGGTWGLPKDGYGKRMHQEILPLIYLFKDAAAEARKALQSAEKNRRGMADFRRRADQAESWAHDRAMDWWVDLTEARRFGPALTVKQKLLGMSQDRRFALGLALCREAALHLENTPEIDLVGSALSHYLDKGVLLADVHGGNIGMVDRADDAGRASPQRVITDPGHAVPLDDRWQSVTIEEL